MKSSKPGTTTGILLIIVGLLFLFDNIFGFVHNFGNIFFRWEVIVIIVGILNLGKSKDNFIAFITIGIGILFLASDFYSFSAGRIIANWWPALIILMGLNILNRHKTRKKSTLKKKSVKTTNAKETQSNINTSMEVFPPDHSELSDEHFNKFFIFESWYSKEHFHRLKYGKIVTVLGSSILDFKHTKFLENNILIDTITLLGGLRIEVPENIITKVSITSIFGGVEDKRHHFNPTITENRQVLTIRGIVLFGGVKIK